MAPARKRTYKTAFNTMAGAKKYYKKRKTAFAKKKAVVNMLGSVVSYKTRYGVDFGPDQTAPYTAKGYTFNAGAYPGTTELLKVYDFYRLAYIQVKVTNITAQAGMITNVPTLYMCSDLNDDLEPTLNWISANPRTKSKTVQSGQSLIVKFKPAILVKSGAIAPSYIQMKNQWLMAASSVEPYYGIKIFIENFGRGDFGAFKMETRATFQFKGIGSSIA